MIKFATKDIILLTGNSFRVKDPSLIIYRHGSAPRQVEQKSGTRRQSYQLLSETVQLPTYIILLIMR